MKRLTLIIFAILTMVSTQTLANITLSQNRLYFGPSDRANAVQLRNTGGFAIQYKTSVHLVKMTEHGEIIKVDTLDNSAVEMMRYSPKRGVVPAGGKQVIRFAIRRPRDLQDGEYRAVLSIATSIATDKPEDVTLKSTLAYNMPVIIRHGDMQASTSIENPQVVILNEHPHVSLTQTLSGNRSLYGNYTVTDENDDLVGVLNGVAVYTPLSERQVLIPLNKKVEGQKLTVSFQEISAFGGREEVRATLAL